jgi:hypothetical protein
MLGYNNQSLMTNYLGLMDSSRNFRFIYVIIFLAIYICLEFCPVVCADIICVGLLFICAGAMWEIWTGRHGFQ